MILCPHCNGGVQFVQALAGQNVSCPLCQQLFQMPIGVMSFGEELPPIPQAASESGRRRKKKKGMSLLAKFAIGSVFTLVGCCFACGLIGALFGDKEKHKEQPLAAQVANSVKLPSTSAPRSSESPKPPTVDKDRSNKEVRARMAMRVAEAGMSPDAIKEAMTTLLKMQPTEEKEEILDLPGNALDGKAILTLSYGPTIHFRFAHITDTGWALMYAKIGDEAIAAKPKPVEPQAQSDPKANGRSRAQFLKRLDEVKTNGRIDTERHIFTAACDADIFLNVFGKPAKDVSAGGPSKRLYLYPCTDGNIVLEVVVGGDRIVITDIEFP